MKKLLYLLLLAPFLLLASCSDDNDVPDVDIIVKMNNVVIDNNVVYLVKDSPFEITEISVTGNGSKAIVTSVSYYWDNIRVAWNPIAPFRRSFDTSYATLGNHTFAVNCEVAQVDKSLGFAAAAFNVKVVDSAKDLPEGTEPGTGSLVFTDSPE